MTFYSARRYFTVLHPCIASVVRNYVIRMKLRVDCFDILVLQNKMLNDPVILRQAGPLLAVIIRYP
jgi:hypothetical protein